MNLNKIENEYIEARHAFRIALSDETAAKITVDKARARLMMARQELRAHDTELLQFENLASISSSQGKS